MLEWGVFRPPSVATLTAAAVLAGALAPPARAFTYGNLVVTRGSEIVEYRPDGIAVSVLPVPFPPGPRGPDDPLGGIMFDSEARLAVYNGAAQPWLSVYQASTGTWTHASLPGWSTFTNPGLAGLVTAGHDVYVTDFGTLEGPERGIVSFDGDAGYAGTRFGLFDTADLSIGPDGRVWALLPFSSQTYGYDPLSGEVETTVALEGPVSGFVVRDDGGFYGVSGDRLRSFDAKGLSQDTLVTAIPEQLDVAIGPGGRLAIGSGQGEVVLTDASLASATTFLVGGGAASVAWVPLHASTPAERNTWGRIKARYRR